MEAENKIKRIKYVNAQDVKRLKLTKVNKTRQAELLKKYAIQEPCTRLPSTSNTQNDSGK